MNEHVKKEIDDIAERNSGKITADLVFNAAKDETTALHAYFEQRGVWDPAKAQERYGLIVAREVIRSVKLKVVTETFSFQVPKFVRDPEAEQATQGYTSLSRLRSDDDLAREVLVAEFSRAGAALKRAQNIAAALGLSDKVARFREELNAFVQTVQHAAPAQAQ